MYKIKRKLAGSKVLDTVSRAAQVIWVVGSEHVSVPVAAFEWSLAT